MAQQRPTPLELWRSIAQAGSVEAYVNQQLKKLGYLVERKDADKMSAREKAQYKKQLKEEAAEKKRLQSEAWEAYKAAHITHVGEHIFWNDLLDYDKWDLENAENRVAELGLPPLDNPRQLAEALSITVSELRWFSYHREAATMVHYEPFTISKGNGESRQIWAPRPRLKRIQRWILRHIVEPITVHGSAHGFLAGRSILSNAAQHTNAKLVASFDVKDFFPTITYPRVKGVFRRAGYREQIATLLALLCTEAPREQIERDGKTLYIAMGPRCLPQGAPTSPGITNVLCFKLDRRLTGLANSLGWRYTRYADDLTFSLPKSHKDSPGLGKLIGSVRRIAEDEGLTLNPNKTAVLRPGSRQDVTGLVVNGDGPPRVNRTYRREIRAALHHLKTDGSARESRTQLAGKIAFVRMVDPELGRKFEQQLAAITPE